MASGGAKRAKTGTPFFGYIIAATLENTDFGDFFHNQITTVGADRKLTHPAD